MSGINSVTATPWFGVYPALVVDNQDPDSQGRVKVRLPWSPDGSQGYETWARLATTMAGADRGTWFVPDPQDEVLIAFGGGNPDQPYVVGALWNGQDSPPQSMDSDNNVKTITSRSNIRITLDDTSGSETLTLSTPGGQKLTMTDGGSSITLEDSNGNSLKMAPDGVTLTSAINLTINTGVTTKVSSPIVQVDAAMSTFSGVVESDTNITQATISTSYTPGAGNVW